MLLTTVLSSQNLVPNGGFEEFTALPNDDCDWQLADGWTNAATTANCGVTNGTPDYYHTLGTGPFSALPDNYYANVLPFEGDAVMGLAGGVIFSPNVREYISTQLCSPLVIGESYVLEFSMTVGNPVVGGFYSNGWGAALSTGPLLQDPGTSSPLVGANQFAVPGIFFNSTTWQTYSFTFVADMAYEYITLGNFVPNSAQVTQFYGTQGAISLAYIFIDDISIAPLVAVDFTASLSDVTICPGEDAILNATVQGGIPPYTFEWSPDIGTTAGPIAVSPGVTTTYTVDVTDCSGAVVSAAATVSVIDENLTVDLGPDQDLCNGAIFLDATTPGATSYEWNTGQTTPVVAALNPGTYSVTVFGICGSATDEVEITECIPELTVSLGADQSICPGTDATLLATATGGLPPYTYAWTPNIGVGAGPFSVSPAATTVYSVVVIDAEGSTATASVTISLIEENLMVDLGPDQDLCNGSALIDATTPGATSYLWNTGQTTAALNVSTPGVYGVTVGGLCETATDQTGINECILPLVVSLGDPQTVCLGQEVILQAQVQGGVPPYVYQWVPSQGSGAGPFSLVPVATSTYMVVVSDAAGTTTNSSVLITVATGVDTIDLGTDTILCRDDTLTLDATTEGATSYLWSTGATTAELNVVLPGNYTVEATGLCGAQQASIRILNGEISTPAFDKVLRVCSGDSVQGGPRLPDGLTATWDDGGEGSPRSLSEEGMYTVSLKSQCSVRNVDLRVEEVNCACDVFVPNSFSPNADGLNDLFGPVLNCEIKQYEFSVYSRQGQLVFSSNNPGIKWDGGIDDGKYYGENTLYVWKLKIEPDPDLLVRDIIEKTGSVMLIR
ncbi:MAG: gliding motility-associated C-terminal domain-containing protein [Cryomorphaceae bacterium]